MDINKNALGILWILKNQLKNGASGLGIQSQSKVKLTAREINDAVDYLKIYGYVKINKGMGTSPFSFQSVILTALGKSYYYDLSRSGNPIKENAEKILILLKSNPKYQNGISNS